MAFSITLYKSRADEKLVNKTYELQSPLTVTGTLKEETSLVRPILLIDTTNISIYQPNKIPDFNYAYIQAFGRYYFITDIVSIRNNLWEVSLECDVLYTYKDAILECYGFIDRCERGYNPMVTDNLVTVTNELEITTTRRTNDVFDTKDGSVVLTGLKLGTVGV